MDSKPTNSVVVGKKPRAPKMVVIEEPAPIVRKSTDGTHKAGKKPEPPMSKKQEKQFQARRAWEENLIKDLAVRGNNVDLDSDEYEDVDAPPKIATPAPPPVAAASETPKVPTVRAKKPRAPKPAKVTPPADSGSTDLPPNPAPAHKPRSRRLEAMDRLSVHPASVVDTKTLKETKDPLAVRDTLMREYYAVRSHTDDIVQKLCALIFKNQSSSLSST